MPAPTTGDPSSKFTRADWTLVAVLAAVQFTHMVDFVIIMPLGKRLMTEFEINDAQFSYIIGAYGLAAGVASLLASLVFDRFDRKLVLGVSYGGFVLATLFCGLSRTYPEMLASRAVAGAFGGLAAAAIMAIIGDAFGPKKRGTATGAVMSAFAVASVAGLPAGLYLAGRFNRGTPFEALAVLGLVVLAAIFALVPKFREHLKYARANVLAEFELAVSEPRHLVAFLFTLTLVFGTFTVASFLGPHFLRVNDAWTEDHELAIVYFVGGFATLITMNVVGRVADRFPKRLVFTVMASVSAVLCLVVTNVTPSTLPLATILLCSFMVFAVGRMVPAQALIIGVPQARNRGAFMSLNTATSNFCTGLAPVVAGLVGGSEHYWRVGIVGAVFATLSIVVAKFVRPVESSAPQVAQPVGVPPEGLAQPHAEPVGAA